MQFYSRTTSENRRRAALAARPEERRGAPATGRIVKLLVGHGHGFIRLDDDREVYFHRADLEDGARFYTQVTDCDAAAVAVDLPVELTFRRFHEGGDLVNYFWKFRPLLGE